MIWILLAIVGIGTGVALAFGVQRRHVMLKRSEGALAILEDQLSEVAKEVERGLITAEEAKAAEIEIKRRLLSLSKNPHRISSSSAGRGVLVAVAVLVPLSAGGLYAVIGAPTIGSQSFSSRAEEQQEAAKIAQLARRLKTRLESDDSGGPTQGWLLLGQTYMRMGRFADASEAFARVIGRDDVNSSTLSQYAEALIAAESGIVTPPAERAIDRAMVIDPMNPAAVYYKAQALEQGGAIVAARAMLIDRLAVADGFYPWMESFVASVNRMGAQTGDDPISLAFFAPMPGGGSPTREQVKAADEMSDEDRAVFIRSMVDRLAVRLEEEPGDLNGWFRLIKAYDVLGETEAAAEARSRAIEAARALPQDDPLRQAALLQLGITED